jgi:hypothetical protein
LGLGLEEVLMLGPRLEVWEETSLLRCVNSKEMGLVLGENQVDSSGILRVNTLATTEPVQGWGLAYVGGKVKVLLLGLAHVHLKLHRHWGIVCHWGLDFDIIDVSVLLPRSQWVGLNRNL